MTFTELLNEVYLITNRPDLVTQTKLAVRSATLFLHQKDFYSKDIREQGISFPSASFTQELDYRILFPNYRAIKYLRKSDVSGAMGSLIHIITPEEVLDSYGAEKVDVAYVAGEVIQVKSSTALQYAVFGFYENPDVTETGFNSWLAAQHPFAIILMAAEKIFKSIGETESFAAYKMMRDEEIANITISNVQDIGY